MSGGALSVMDLVATLGVKLKTGDWANARAAVEGLKASAELLVKPFEFALDQIRETAAVGDRIGGLSETFGISAQSLQEWSGAAEMADVEASSFTTALGYLSRQMGAAAEGSAEAVEAMGGVAATGLDGKLRPLIDVLDDVADHINSLPEGATRVAATLKVMGRGSKEMVGMLGRGSGALAELRRQVVSTGVVMSQALVDAGGKLDDSAKLMRMSFDGMRNAFASAEVIDALGEIQDALGEVARSKGARAAMEVLGRVVLTVFKALSELARGVAVFLNEHPELGLNLLITAVEALAIYALPALATGLAAVLPVMIGFAAGFAALYLLADDISVFMEGGDSMIGSLVDLLKTPISANDSPILKMLKSMGDLVLALSGDLPSTSWIYSIGPYLDHVFEVAEKIQEIIASLETGHVGGARPATEYPGFRRFETPEEVAARMGSQPGSQRKGGDTTLNNTINLTAPAGATPSEVGASVAGAMDAWWDNKVRDEFVSLGTP